MNTTPVLASDERFPRYVLGGTHVRVLPPASDGRQHSVFIGFPYAYEKDPTRKFPVLYLCDGFWDFAMMVGFYGNIIWEKAAPEFFIVGLSYGGNQEHPKNDEWRHCDYLPQNKKFGRRDTDWTHKEYLSYLKDTIMPFVESEYTIDGSYRVLGGCSIGGLFALSAMFREPKLFQGIIALNPPLDSYDGWIFHEERRLHDGNRQSLLEKLRWKSPVLLTKLFLSVAEYDTPELKGQVEKLKKTLAGRAYKGLELKHVTIPEEGHGASKAAGYSRGIRHAFSGYGIEG